MSREEGWRRLEHAVVVDSAGIVKRGIGNEGRLCAGGRVSPPGSHRLSRPAPLWALLPHLLPLANREGAREQHAQPRLA